MERRPFSHQKWTPRRMGPAQPNRALALGPFWTRCVRAVLKWKVDAFYRCRTPIPFSHFGKEEKWSFVCENEMGPAQPNRALSLLTALRKFINSTTLPVRWPAQHLTPQISSISILPRFQINTQRHKPAKIKTPHGNASTPASGSPAIMKNVEIDPRHRHPLLEYF